MISGTDEKRLSSKQNVKVRFFSGASIKHAQLPQTITKESPLDNSFIYMYK